MNDAQIALAVVIRFQICIFDILNTAKRRNNDELLQL